ncbi:MAG: NUDIX hydrolase [Acidimicrobiia bacterium]
MPFSLIDDVVDTIASASADDRYRSEWLTVAKDVASITRAGIPSHFTASALPVTADATRVCLVLHRRMGLWVQPGGHFEPEDPTVVAAARREMVEETGLSGEVEALPLLLSRHRAPCGVGDWHLDIQMLATVEEALPVVSDESLDVAWFDASHLPPDAASGVADLVAKAVTRLSRIELRGAGSRPE